MGIWVFLTAAMICATFVLCTWIMNNDWAGFSEIRGDIMNEFIVTEKYLKEIYGKLEKVEKALEKMQEGR